MECSYDTHRCHFGLQCVKTTNEDIVIKFQLCGLNFILQFHLQKGLLYRISNTLLSGEMSHVVLQRQWATSAAHH